MTCDFLESKKFPKMKINTEFLMISIAGNNLKVSSLNNDVK